MIDIHCHILPNVDDGAADLKESLEMVRMAADSGVEAIIATPHFTGERRSLSRLELMMDRYEQLRNAIAEAGLPVRLYPGAEILCQPQTPELARRGLLPTLADTDYLLMEFYFGEGFDYLNEMVEAVAAQGYLPVIAHPERYSAIQRNPRLLEIWFRRGYVIQINKGSILGSLGEEAQRTALWALDRGLAHLIASDAHSTRYRTARMSRLRRWLEEQYQEEYVRLLLEENPSLLLRGEPMAPL